MSKLRRGLAMAGGTGTKDSEPFGTIRSEPFRMDENVERSASQLASGRPPVMDDAALQALARQMNTQLGRPPKADELIREAGGCQRKRALAAIQSLRSELAQRSVRSQLLFPAAIESHLRALMGEWIDLASAHLAQRHAEIIESQDERSDAAKAHADDLQHRLIETQATANVMSKRLAEVNQLIQMLTAERDQARADCDALKVVAAERQRVIDQLVLGPAMVASASSEAA